MEKAIGIDLGGTNIKLAVCAWPDGDVLENYIMPTSDGKVQKGTDPPWLEAIRAKVNSLESSWGYKAKAVGLCAPGIADKGSTCITCLPGRLGGIEGLDWTQALARQNKATVLNDAHAALLGEIWKGGAKGQENVLLLTLGTGVGGAAVVGGKLLTGHIGRGGHFGHISLDPEGSRDCVGTPGSLEDAVGECTLPARSQNRFNNTLALVEAHVAGDDVARSIFLRSIRALAAGICSLVNALDPSVVLLSGGITKAGETLLLPLREELDKIEWRPGGARVEVRIAEHQEWAGAYGALYRSLDLNGMLGIRRDERF
jgi:glucokinase